jgi:hypothetical protein
MAVDYMAALALFSHCYVTEAVIAKTLVIKITGYRSSDIPNEMISDILIILWHICSRQEL